MSEASPPAALLDLTDLHALGPFGPKPKLAVAVSGGADSLALTLLAERWAQARGGSLTALTVDHGLRPESRAEAETVAALLGARFIAHHILTPPHTDASRNVQEAARHWRYDALAEWCRAHDVLHCLIAHHAGDQRETVQLHTTRGETADGPAGMSVIRNYRGVRFLRPLLATEKSTLEAYLRREGIDWIEDPSNQNTRFARVRTRKALAHDASAERALTDLAATEAAARAARDDVFATLAAAHVTLFPAGYAELTHVDWLAVPEAEATRLLADLLTTVSGNVTRPRRGDTERLAAALRIASPPCRRTLHGCEVTLREGMIRIARERARVAAPITLSGEGRIYWDRRFRADYALAPNATLTLGALADAPARPHWARKLPPAAPVLWHLDQVLGAPHITEALAPHHGRVVAGFAPAKPLAAAPFWWFKSKEPS